MGKLVYSAITSLDGYVADRDGNFRWSMPDHEVHRFVNDHERPIGTHLLGRRMYEVLSAWETMDDDDPVMRDYAQIWRAADKVVFSRTLEAVVSERTTIQRAFDPDAVRQMKADAGRDLSVGGPELAAEALRARLVDEIALFLSPVVVGGGKPALPADLRLRLELLDQRRFGNGVVFLRYAVT